MEKKDLHIVVSPSIKNKKGFTKVPLGKIWIPKIRLLLRRRKPDLKRIADKECPEGITESEVTFTSFLRIV